MKKLLLLSLFAFNMAIAQEFVLTPNNFVNKDDESKNYIVLEYPEMNQKQLYDKTKIFIQSTFKNLKGDGLNEVEYSYIKVRARTPGTKVKAFGSESITTFMLTTYEMKFKDGKLMIKPVLEQFDPNIEGVDVTYLNGGNSWSGKSIFNKDGKVWLNNYYESANTTVNKLINVLKEYLSKKEDW